MSRRGCVCPQSPLLASPSFSHSPSLPQHLQSAEVEDATEATSFCLLFSSLKVFGIDLESFQKPDEALALFMVGKLTNTDCSNPLQMCCSKLCAGCKQTKINIQDKNDRQHAASCQAPPQVMLRITILKHALNLERIAVLKCHFSRTSQILKVAN